MNIILFGPPGVGKGTQAVLLAAGRGLKHLSTGEMLRELVKTGSEVGKRVDMIMTGGGFVSDDIVIGIIADRIDQPDCANGFILDGFPRNLKQAVALDELLRSKGKAIDRVIEIHGEERALVERISGRFSCANCGANYHGAFKLPKLTGVCDYCGATKFTRRADDNVETVRVRLMAYYRETAPLIGYYFCKGGLESVDGMPPVDEVARNINAVLD